MHYKYKMKNKRIIEFRKQTSIDLINKIQIKYYKYFQITNYKQ